MALLLSFVLGAELPKQHVVAHIGAPIRAVLERVGERVVAVDIGWRKPCRRSATSLAVRAERSGEILPATIARGGILDRQIRSVHIACQSDWAGSGLRLRSLVWSGGTNPPASEVSSCP